MTKARPKAGRRDGTVWIDVHNHCMMRRQGWPSPEKIIDSMERLGIDQTCCSAPITYTVASPEAIREYNDDILACMEKYPGRILGQCFVNPGYPQHAQDEITRCIVDGGMIGLKLYHQYRIDEPIMFPIIERCIDLGVSILVHAAHLTGPEDIQRQPRCSSGEHFVAAGKRYPESMLICGHIGGGGDWEWQLKALREVPNVYADTSGSVIDAGMIERSVREMGAERLLFATDISAERGVGKLLDADITEAERTMIAGRNFQKILARRRA